jgi:hypothetical protein
MKHLWLVAILLIIPAGVCSGKGPKIEFDQSAQNVGKVPYGTSAKTSFHFTNKGDEPLIIKSVSADCGCTKALIGSREIPPRSRGEITASFDTEGLKAGPKEKHVYVASNDAERSEVTLKLIAEVIRDLEAEPSSMSKTLEKFQETVTFPVKITNSSTVPHSIVGVKSAEGEAKPAIEPHRLTVTPGSPAPLDIVVTLTRQGRQPFLLGKVLLETDHPREREIEIKYLIKLSKPD